MGQVTIEIPQNVNRFYRVKDSKFSRQLLRELDEIANDEEMPAFIPPRRDSLKEDLTNAVGIWADREESAEEIARKIRDRNNGKND